MMPKAKQDRTSAGLRRILQANEGNQLPYGLPHQVEKIRARFLPSKVKRAYLLSKSIREWGIDPIDVLVRFKELPRWRRDVLQEVLPECAAEISSLRDEYQFIRNYSLDVCEATPITLSLRRGRGEEEIVNTESSCSFECPLHAYTNLEEVLSGMKHLQFVTLKKYADNEASALNLFNGVRSLEFFGEIGPSTINVLADFCNLKHLAVEWKSRLDSKGSRRVLKNVVTFSCEGELADGFDWAILPSLEGLTLYSGKKRELPTKNFPSGLKSLFLRNYRFDWNELFGEVLGLRNRASKQARLESATLCDNLEPLAIPTGLHTSLSDFAFGGCKIEGLANLADSKNLTTMQIHGGRYDEEDLAALLKGNRKLRICLRKKSAERIKERFPDIADRVFHFPYWRYGMAPPNAVGSAK